MVIDFYIFVTIAEDLRGKSEQPFVPGSHDLCSASALVNLNLHVITPLFKADFVMVKAIGIVHQFVHAEHGVFDPPDGDLDITGKGLGRLK